MALATLNLLNLRAQARKKSGVSSTDYSNALLDADINQAYLTLAGILANIGEDHFEEQHDKFNLIANSGLYSLPADTMAVKQIRLAYSTPTGPSSYRIATSYDPTSVHDISADEESIPTSNPIVDFTGNYFRIKPTPTAAVTAGGEIDYIAAPSALVATGDTPVIPLQYHEMLAIFGAKEMTFKYEKWSKYDRLSSAWNEKIGELTQILADRDRNNPVRFKSILEAGTPRSSRRELPN